MAKQVGKGRERDKTKIIVLFRSYPTRKNKLKKKQQKNLKNSIIPLLASFQAKICWKMQRKRESKNYRYVSFLLDGEEKIPKKQQKNSKKLKNTITASFQAKIGWKIQRK